MTAFMILICCLHVSAGSLSQTVTITAKNIALREVFTVIEQQTGYVTPFRKDGLKGGHAVTISVKNEPLADFLKQVLKDQPFDFEIADKTIILIPKKKTPELNLQMIQAVSPADIIVRGRVLGENDKPLSGAVVNIKGEGRARDVFVGTSGGFSILVHGTEAVLIVSYIGYKTKEITVSNADVELIIRLEVETAELADVAVVSTGYQSVPKERSTGSFEKIDNELLNRNQGANVLERLEGVAAGLLVDRRFVRNDRPRLTDVSIRGLSTLTSTMAVPLVILDNFPFEGNIHNINPNDIESITILKDAAAASIWGARAGNGVIVITTKKGAYSQNPQISFNGNVAVIEKPDLLALPQISSSDYIDLESILFSKGFYDANINNRRAWPYVSPVVEWLVKARNGVITQDEAAAQISQLRNYDVRNDFEKYMYRTQVKQQYALNVRGGSQHFSYLVSAGYDKELSAVKTNENDRVTLHSELLFRPVKKLELEVGSFYTQTRDDAPGRNSVYVYNTNIIPYTRLADDNGNPAVVGRDYRSGFLDTVDSRYLDWRFRPLAELDASLRRVKVSNLLLNVGATYRFSGVFSVDVKYQRGKTVTDDRDWQGQNAYYVRDKINRLTTLTASSVTRNIPLGGFLSQTTGNADLNNWRVQLNAGKNWGSKHQLNAIAGAEQRETHSTSYANTVYGYDPDLITFQNVDNITGFITRFGTRENIPSGISFSDRLYRFVSLYGNAAYTYSNRYTVSASTRKDAANLFGVNANQRGAPFWSAGFSWLISSESFYHAGVLPYLKLKTTYGLQGNTNNALSAYSTIRYSTGPDFLVNQYYADLINPANDNLRWEKVGTWNFGLDFRFKNNRLSGSIEYYRKKSQDVLYSTPLDYTSGFSYATYNSVSLKGSGLDVQLHSVNLRGAITWNTDLLWSNINNTVTRYIPVVPLTGAGVLQNGLSILPVEGKPASTIYGYKWAGLDPVTGDPQGYVKGLVSKDYTILTQAGVDDLQYFGSATPTWFGSLRNTFNYRRFNISFNITAKMGYYFRESSINYSSLFQIGVTGSSHSDYAKRWQKAGDEAFTHVPSLAYPANSLRDQFYTNSSVLVEKADHIRLQDVVLGYTMGNTRWGMQNMRFYLNIANLGILWRANKAGLDPDYYLGFPPAKMFTFGVNANF